MGIACGVPTGKPMAQPGKIFCDLRDQRDGISPRQPKPGLWCELPGRNTALGAIVAMSTHRFLPDATRAQSLPPVSTSKDVTDAHLVHLARRHRLKLATFEAALCDKQWARGMAEDPTR
jgi:hypothetical protein